MANITKFNDIIADNAIINSEHIVTKDIVDKIKNEYENPYYEQTMIKVKGSQITLAVTNCIVDWGDGNFETFSTGGPSHTYANIDEVHYITVRPNSGKLSWGSPVVYGDNIDIILVKFASDSYQHTSVTFETEFPNAEIWFTPGHIGNGLINFGHSRAGIYRCYGPVLDTAREAYLTCANKIYVPMEYVETMRIAVDRMTTNGQSIEVIPMLINDNVDPLIEWSTENFVSKDYYGSLYIEDSSDTPLKLRNHHQSGIDIFCTDGPSTACFVYQGSGHNGATYLHLPDINSDSSDPKEKNQTIATQKWVLDNVGGGDCNVSLTTYGVELPCQNYRANIILEMYGAPYRYILKDDGPGGEYTFAFEDDQIQTGVYGGTVATREWVNAQNFGGGGSIDTSNLVTISNEQVILGKKEFVSYSRWIGDNCLPVIGTTTIGKDGIYVVDENGSSKYSRFSDEYIGVTTSAADLKITSNGVASTANEFIFSRKIPGTNINGGVFVMTEQNNMHHISLQGQVLTLQSWGTDINNKKIASGISLQPTGNIAFKQTNASGETYSNSLPSKEGTIPVAYVDDQGYLHIDT